MVFFGSQCPQASGGSWGYAFAGSVVLVKLNKKEDEKEVPPVYEWITSLFVPYRSLEVERRTQQPDKDDFPFDVLWRLLLAVGSGRMMMTVVSSVLNRCEKK